MVEVYQLRCDGVMLRCCVAELNDGSIAGCIDIPTPKGVMRFAAKVPREVVLSAYSRALPWLRQQVQTGGVEIVGRFGSRLKKAFKGKLIGKLGRLGSKILNSKVMRGAMKIAKLVPGYGQVANQAYKAARKASEVASRLGRGQGGARQAVRQLRQVAERRTLPNGASASGEQVAVARNALDRVRSAYLNRYGSRLERIVNQGGAVGSEQIEIVTGAEELGLLQRFKQWAFRRGVPELPGGGLRGLYRDGLAALA